VSLAEWMQFLDINLRWADGPITRFFRNIFLREVDVPELPIMSPNSDILNKEMLSLLYLSNNR